MTACHLAPASGLTNEACGVQAGRGAAHEHMRPAFGSDFGSPLQMATPGTELKGLWNQLVGESPAPGTPARSFVQLERVLHQVEDEVQRELAGLESKLRSVHADQLLAQCAMERKLLRTEVTKTTAVPRSLDLGVTDTIPEVPEDEQAPSPCEVSTPSRSSGYADRLAKSGDSSLSVLLMEDEERGDSSTKVVGHDKKLRLSHRRSGRQKYTDQVLEQARAKSAMLFQLRKKASVAIGSAPPQVIMDAEASAARWRRIRKVNDRPKSTVHSMDEGSATLPKTRSVSPVRGNYTADSVPPTRAEMLVAMQRKVLHADSASRKAAVAVRRRSITGLNTTTRGGGSSLDGDGPILAPSVLSAGSASVDSPAPQMPVFTAVPPTPFERTDSGVPVFSVSLAELMSSVPETPGPQTRLCEGRATGALTDVGPHVLQTDTSMSSPMSTTSAPPPPTPPAQTRLWSSLHSMERHLPGRSAVVRSPTHSMIPQTPHTPGGSMGWSTSRASANGSTAHVSQSQTPSSSGRRSWAEREAAKHMQSLTQWRSGASGTTSGSSASPITDLSQRLACAGHISTTSLGDNQLNKMMQEAEELEKSLAVAGVGGMKALGILQNRQVNLSPIHISTGERAKVQADLRAASCCSSNSSHDPSTKEDRSLGPCRSEGRYSVSSPAVSVATAVAGTVMKRAAPICATAGGELAKQAVTANLECESDASPKSIQEEAQARVARRLATRKASPRVSHSSSRLFQHDV